MYLGLRFRRRVVGRPDKLEDDDEIVLVIFWWISIVPLLLFGTAILFKKLGDKILDFIFKTLQKYNSVSRSVE